MSTPVLQEVSIIDINMGCPVPKVVKTGSGSALMEDPKRAAAIVSACKKKIAELCLNVPVTVKTRIGYNSEDKGKPEFAKALADAGCDMICVHGRTRIQMYHGESSNEAIAVMREAVRDYMMSPAESSKAPLGIVTSSPLSTPTIRMLFVILLPR